MNHIINNQRGSLVLWAAIAIPLLLILAALMLDTGRFLIARAQLQTLVDASSLAGAMTAEVIPEKEVQTVTDDAGNPIGIEEKITGYHIEIDTEKAKEAALKTALLNGSPSFWANQGGYFTLDETPDAEKAGWEGYPVGEDSYYTRARVWMKPGFFAPVLRSFSDSNHVPIYIDSTSRAFFVNPTE
ncbi:Tad domain-containing protein [Desulfoscipio geothermicus]|uniref:Putative Flp pilus-assembly TadE/G-like n=1 Tax=Desulfoscipio geothermicus DSM 3669 TaxID=1121426 RepID=A0A1I6DNF4_9FIRM|nr:Tad domain-containing protein [Desulfoscipio geothermicus]SFR06969.1 Putative Flp pilus-assembly TadE/G-like [Desulfoscipio geothermicus DSM 3669]